MADLTSELTIKGTVNGRVINIDNTYTLSTVLRTAIRNGSVTNGEEVTAFMGSGVASTGPDPVAQAASPDFLCIMNKSTHAWLYAGVAESGGQFIKFELLPGEFLLLYRDASAGAWNTTATGTSVTTVDLDEVSLAPAGLGGTASYDALLAYT